LSIDPVRRVSDGRSLLKPTLYFHPNGLLMHCGFSEQCSECPHVSIQSLSRLPIDDARPPNEPDQWVCATKWGVFAPASDIPELALICYAPPPPAP
jgi:hypothetical protein